jgi:Cu/Ag efflux pump CusA
MDYVDFIARLFGGLGGIGTLITILILHKAGVLKILVSNGASLGSLDAKLGMMTDNHLAHIEDAINLLREENTRHHERLMEKFDQHNDLEERTFQIVKEIKEYGVKTRKGK